MLTRVRAVFSLFPPSGPPSRAIMIFNVEESKLPDLGSGVKRSKGAHVTEVIQDIAYDLGIFSKDSELPYERFEVGFNWEYVLEQAWASRCIKLGKARHYISRPDEFELDGLSGSPDGIGYSADGSYLEEYKCTWKSFRKFDFEDQWYWLTQAKAYLMMVGLTHCVHRVLFINGNYSPPYPIYAIIRSRFDEMEIEENWNMIIRHAERKGFI